MQCNGIREMLSAHLDGVLEPSEHALVSQHLVVCPACRSEWEDLRSVVELVRELPEISPPAEFRHNLRKRIESMPVHQPNIKKATGLWPALTGNKIFRGMAVAATVILTVGVTALWYGLPGQWGNNKGTANDIVSSGKGTAITEKTGQSNNGGNIKGEKDAEVLDILAADSGTLPVSGSENQNDTMKAKQGNQSLALKNPAPKADRGMFDMAATESNSGSVPESSARTAPPGMGGGGGMAGIAATPLALRNGGDKTIRQASLDLDVADVDQVTQKLSSLTWSYGGMVAANNAPGGSMMEIRVPSTRFDEVVDRIEALGKVVHKNITSKDVTSDFDSAVTSLAALENKENILLEENKGEPVKAPATGIMAAGGPEIKQLQLEKEAKQNQLRELEDATVMATINVKLE